MICEKSGGSSFGVADGGAAGVEDVLRFRPLLAVLVKCVGLLVELGLLGDEGAQDGEALLFFGLLEVVPASRKDYLYSVLKVPLGL